MRIPRAISYTGLKLFESNTTEYIYRYICENRLPRFAQTPAMAMGSAFDAYVKSNLYATLYGVNHDPQFEFTALFESQVEPQNRDLCRISGLHIFDDYVYTGAYDDLLDMLKVSLIPPQFEFDASGMVDGVPLFGKPDCKFTLLDGISAILDWKVLGYCSKSSASPHKHYIICNDGQFWPKPSKSHGMSHVGATLIDYHDIVINEGYLEDGHAPYADQSSIYAWLTGSPVGNEEFVVFIDEIVAKSRQHIQMKPLLRVAQHRARISSDHQTALLARLKRVWQTCQDHMFYPHLPQEENSEIIKSLERQAGALLIRINRGEEHFNKFVRRDSF